MNDRMKEKKGKFVELSESNLIRDWKQRISLIHVMIQLIAKKEKLKVSISWFQNWRFPCNQMPNVGNQNSLWFKVRISLNVWVKGIEKAVSSISWWFRKIIVKFYIFLPRCTFRMLLLSCYIKNPLNHLTIKRMVERRVGGGIA